MMIDVKGTTDGGGPKDSRHELRGAVASIVGELSRLTGVGALLASWSMLLKVLSPGRVSHVRACPVCGAAGARDTPGSEPRYDRLLGAATEPTG